jgi:hypothetical protein
MCDRGVNEGGDASEEAGRPDQGERRIPRTSERSSDAVTPK